VTDLHTVSDVAATLKVSRRTVERLIAGGHLAAVTLPLGGRRVTDEALHALLVARGVESAPAVDLSEWYSLIRKAS